MDLVNFQVGSKTVALPILNILLTERFDNDLTELPNDNVSFIGIKDFMNLPVPVFDLGFMLNGGSTADSNQDLIAKLQQHRTTTLQWLTTLNGQVQQSTNGINFESAQQTPYVKWLNSFNSDSEDLSAILQRISELLDSLYKQACDSQNQQSWQRGFDNGLSHISRMFDSAIEQVEVSYKPIIVFTTKDGREPHVGLLVDKVEDSINVAESEIKALNAVTAQGFEIDEQTKQMMQGLVQLENKHSLIIDPSNLFVEQQQSA